MRLLWREPAPKWRPGFACHAIHLQQKAEAELAALRSAVRDAQDGIEAIVAHDYTFHTVEGALAAVAHDLRQRVAPHMGGDGK